MSQSRRGPVRRAIAASVTEGQVFYTPSRQAPFKVGKVDNDGLVLLLGAGEWSTRLTWECLERIVPYIKQHGGVIDVGGQYQVTGIPGTLDGYLKGCVKVNTAGWVAVVLEEAGVVEIIRDRPARVKLV